MVYSFSNQLIEWRGPAPFYFVAIPQKISDEIALVAKDLSYGWGVIPVTATLEMVTFTTSLFPKDGSYLLPVKAAVRMRAQLELGDAIKVQLRLGK